MKKTGLFKIIMFVLLGTVIASWIFSASYFESGNLADLGMNNVGLYDFFDLATKSFSFDYFIQILLLLICIGAFYGVLEKTGKYRAWVERIANNNKGREFIFIVAVSIIIALLTSILDYGFALYVFFPLIISILLAMGYDKITVAVATFGSSIIGTIGSTIGYNTTGVISELLSIKLFDGFYYKLTLLLLSYVALLLYLTTAKRKKVTEEELEKKDLFIGEKTANKYSTLPIIITFCLIFVLLVLGCTNWEKTFNVKVFNTFHEKVIGFSPKLPYFHVTTDGIEKGVKEVEIVSKIFGDYSGLGSWFYQEIAIVCLFASLLIARIYKVKYFESMYKGAKKMLKPALMVLLAYTVIYFAGNQMFYPTIAKVLLGLTNKFSVVISSICMALASLLHVDILYVSNYAVPQIAQKASDPVIVSLLSQSIYGLSMFVFPTSAVLVFGLTYLGIPYKEWLKKTWKLALALLVIVMAILLIAKFI